VGPLIPSRCPFAKSEDRLIACARIAANSSDPGSDNARLGRPYLSNSRAGKSQRRAPILTPGRSHLLLSANPAESDAHSTQSMMHQRIIDLAEQLLRDSVN
jgi:hypothetical protein